MDTIKAFITKRNGKPRSSRGFSPKELTGACLTLQDAKKMSIPVDIKRKSFHNDNIQALKAHAEKAKAEAEAKPKKPKTEPAEKSKKKAKR